MKPIFALIIGFSFLSFASKAVSSDETTNPYAMFYSGDIIGAIELLKEVSLSAKTPVEKINANLGLLYICSSALDFECFDKSLSSGFEELSGSAKAKMKSFCVVTFECN